MALSHEQQAIELINRSKRILITTGMHASIDALASAVAMFAYLKKHHKQADIVSPGIVPAAIPSFIPFAKDVRSELSAVRACEIQLDVTKTPLSELMYDVKDGKLIMTVVPKSGEWTSADLTMKPGQDRYDLVIALGCTDMASLGKLFTDSADFLYRTPLVNIDRDPGNEHWGQVNLVDVTAVATTEVLFGMFERWNRHHIDDEIATALLAGMIAHTQSFRTPNVTPKTLQTASHLLTMGARREEIVHGLWRTKSIPTLKLWGRALARLNQDREHGMVWSTLSRQDFLDAGAEDAALEGIVHELVAYAPDASVVVLAYETATTPQTGACVSIYARPPHSAEDLGRPFGATGTRDRVQFYLLPGESLTSGTTNVIERLRETIGTTRK